MSFASQHLLFLNVNRVNGNERLHCQQRFGELCISTSAASSCSPACGELKWPQPRLADERPFHPFVRYFPALGTAIAPVLSFYPLIFQHFDLTLFFGL